MMGMEGLVGRCGGLLTRIGVCDAMLCCDVAVRCKPVDTQLRRCMKYPIVGTISRTILFTNRLDGSNLIDGRAPRQIALQSLALQGIPAPLVPKPDSTTCQYSCSAVVNGELDSHVDAKKRKV